MMRRVPQCEEMIIPAGALFTASTGEYSDYCVHGVFRAVKEIDAGKLRAEWMADHPDQNEDYKFDTIGFFGRLTLLGLMEPVDSFELHLGEYSTANFFMRHLPNPTVDN